MDTAFDGLKYIVVQKSSNKLELFYLLDVLLYVSNDYGLDNITDFEILSVISENDTIFLKRDGILTSEFYFSIVRGSFTDENYQSLAISIEENICDEEKVLNRKIKIYRTDGIVEEQNDSDEINVKQKMIIKNNRFLN